jgi:hypothetical protein
VPNHPSINSNHDNRFNDTKAAAAQNQTANQAANTHMQKPAPKLNLVQVNNCSLTLQAWKDTNGVNATVYHIPQDTWNNADDSNILSPGNPSILLFYAHLVTLDPSKQSQPNVASNKEDVLTQFQMLKASDSQCFIQSQSDEIAGLEKFDVMDIHPISSLPKSTKLLSSIWSYRRKHSPNSTPLKHKSHICVNGKEQAFGRDYWETYAPVASWATIRMLLILSSLMNLKTRQVDYMQAFPQALLEDPVFMRVPQGWFVKNGKLTQHQNPNGLVIPFLILQVSLMLQLVTRGRYSESYFYSSENCYL